MNFDPGMFGSGAGSFFGGLFGNSGAPYDKAMQQYQQYAGYGQGVQAPFFNAGAGAIPQFQNWLGQQSNPSEFINNLMKNYQESPNASYLKQQAQNAGMNAASASGLVGSTPLMEQLQKNAANISSQDQNQWLQNVLGINNQYGNGLNSLMGGGQNAANSLMQLYNQLGQQMGEGAYGKEAGKNQDFWNMLGGLGGILGSFF